jgi:peptide-N4-(N-acetyl-beta-glucosaminyl)asparagine amidase
VLLYILSEIRSARRRNLSKDQKFKLEGEESFENRELRHYYVEALMKDVLKIVPNKHKTEEQRREEEADRRKAEERALEGVIARERTGSQEGRTTPSRRAPDMPPPGGNPLAR